MRTKISRNLAILLVIVSLVAFLCVSGVAYARDKTTLRVVGKPQGTFRSGPLGTHLTDVSVVVRNVGSITAEDVQVYVVVSGGQRIDVYRGPSKIEPNKKATYTASAYDQVPNDATLKAEVSCSNCR